MNVRYRVELSQAERNELTAMLGGGKHAARKLKRAQILLAADAGSGRGGVPTSSSISAFSRIAFCNHFETLSAVSASQAVLIR